MTHLIVHGAGAGARFHIDRLLSTACVTGSTADGVVDRRHAVARKTTLNSTLNSTLALGDRAVIARACER